MYYWCYFLIQWISISCWQVVGLWWVSIWFLLLLFPLIILRLDSVRIRIRTLRICGQRPSTDAELHACVKECIVKSRQYTIVGQGWHFFLKRKIPDGEIIFTDTFNKPYLFKSTTFYPCGMTIATLCKEMKKEDRAFHSLPSYENISLGAWVIDSNHGSSGDTGQASNYAFDKIDFIDADGNRTQLEYSLGMKENIKCLIGISFVKESLNMNTTIYEKSAMIIKNNDLSAWLKPSFQRVLFIGRKSIGVVWRSRNTTRTPKRRCCGRRCSRYAHTDPHCCSRFCLWLQIDPLNYNDQCGCCKLFECFSKDVEDYNSIVHNYEMNRLVPYIATVMTVFACNTYNFEIFVDLWKMKKLQFFNRLHTELSKIKSGRFELRYGKRYLFIDVSLRNNFEEPFKILKNLGIKQVALHTGKYDVIQQTLSVISVNEFFAGPGTDASQRPTRLRLRF